MRRRMINQQRQRRLTHYSKLVDNKLPLKSTEPQLEIDRSPEYQPKLDGLSDPRSLLSVSPMLESDEPILILEVLESEKQDLLQSDQLKQSSPLNSVEDPDYILYPENGI